MGTDRAIAARQRVGDIDAAQQRQGISTAQSVFGLAESRAGVANQQADTGITRAQFGDENASLAAGAAAIAALENEKTKLLGMTNLPTALGLERDRRVSAIDQQQTQIGVGTRSEAIGKIETTAGIANLAADNDLNRALRLGTGNDVRGSAVGSDRLARKRVRPAAGPDQPGRPDLRPAGADSGQAADTVSTIPAVDGKTVLAATQSGPK